MQIVPGARAPGVDDVEERGFGERRARSDRRHVRRSGNEVRAGDGLDDRRGGGDDGGLSLRDGCGLSSSSSGDRLGGTGRAGNGGTGDRLELRNRRLGGGRLGCGDGGRLLLRRGRGSGRNRRRGGGRGLGGRRGLLDERLADGVGDRVGDDAQGVLRLNPSGKAFVEERDEVFGGEPDFFCELVYFDFSGGQGLLYPLRIGAAHTCASPDAGSAQLPNGHARRVTAHSAGQALTKHGRFYSLLMLVIVVTYLEHRFDTRGCKARVSLVFSCPLGTRFRAEVGTSARTPRAFCRIGRPTRAPAHEANEIALGPPLATPNALPDRPVGLVTRCQGVHA